MLISWSVFSVNFGKIIFVGACMPFFFLRGRPGVCFHLVYFERSLMPILCFDKQSKTFNRTGHPIPFWGLYLAVTLKFFLVPFCRLISPGWLHIIIAAFPAACHLKSSKGIHTWCTTLFTVLSGTNPGRQSLDSCNTNKGLIVIVHHQSDPSLCLVYSFPMQ